MKKWRVGIIGIGGIFRAHTFGSIWKMKVSK